jgi:DNA-binding protein HU-alpha
MMSTTKPKTTTKKTTAPKTTAKKTTTSKASTATETTAPAATPVVVDSPELVVSGPMMRKKELVDLVVERSGIKKKDAKPVVEAMLAVLGEAITDSRELNLHPMGKLKVRRVKQLPNGRVMMTKIRQSTGPDSSGDKDEASDGTNSVPDAAE